MELGAISMPPYNPHPQALTQGEPAQLHRLHHLYLHLSTTSRCFTTHTRIHTLVAETTI